MDFQQLRVDHNKAIADQKAIDLFIDDNYNRNIRVDIKALARKLRLSIVETQVQLFTWAKALSNTREARIHRLCIFMNDLHTKPQWFGFLQLSLDDNRSIHNASRQIGLPDKRHWSTLNRLVESANGWDKVSFEVNHARDIIIGSLFNHGFVPDGTEPTIEITAEECRKKYMGSQFCNREDFGDIQLYHSWGYLTMEKLDQLQAKPIESEDLHILKKKGDVEDDSKERKAIASKLRHFIDEVQDRGLMFVHNQLHLDHLGNGKYSHCPMLVFSRPNELSATIKVIFRQYADIGRVILDI